MQHIKNTKEELQIQLIKKGLLIKKRRPNVIPIYSLPQAIKKVNLHKLAKEMAFCLSTELYYRLAYEDRYMIAFNSVVVKDWKKVAVINVSNKLNKFNCLVCVDLNEYNKEFRINNPVFMKLLLCELNIIRRG